MICSKLATTTQEKDLGDTADISVQTPVQVEGEREKENMKEDTKIKAEAALCC